LHVGIQLLEIIILRVTLGDFCVYMPMNDSQTPYILAIESSCDETAAAVMQGPHVKGNVISSQIEHEAYGGVIPELASRLHQQHIVPVVQQALREAGVTLQDLDGIAVTQGPGLLGALLVGHSFAKALAAGLDIPLLTVHHMQAHVLANFLTDTPPAFPFICLTVSGGHTQLVLVRDYLDMEVLGGTIDDAAGEAFDKAAKLMDLPYPGGPQIDRLAKEGDASAFRFPEPEVGPLEFSFSGLKTSLLYLLKDGIKKDPQFIEKHKADIAASYQKRIVDILLKKLASAAAKYQVDHLAIAGGVSANSELRRRFEQMCADMQKTAHIPPFAYCTDNAAMIGYLGYRKYQRQWFGDLESTPYPRGPFEQWRN